MPSTRLPSGVRLNAAARWALRAGLTVLPLLVVITGAGGGVLRILAAAVCVAAWVSIPLTWGRPLIAPSAPIRRRDFNTIK